MNTTVAGPVACAKAIKDCVDTTKAITQATKTARAECEALRDCKQVCKKKKQMGKKGTKNNKQQCMDACDGKKGKAKRQCKADCREDKRETKKNVNAEKKGCVDVCKDQYKTAECKQARRDLIDIIAKDAPKCAAKFSAGCAP